MRRAYYWPHTDNDLYRWVEARVSCRRNLQTYTLQRHLQLFHTSCPLEFVTRKILASLPKASTGNRLGVVITDGYSKLTRTIPMKKTMEPRIAAIFTDNWVISNGVPEFLLTKNGPQFVRKFSNSISLYFGTKLLTTTTYHPQTIRLGKRHNKTIATQLPHDANKR